MFFRRAVLLMLCLALGACTTTAGVSVEDLFSDTVRSMSSVGKPVREGKASARLLAASTDPADSISAAYHEGTGSYVSARRPAIEEGTTSRGGRGYTLNLVDAPIATAAKGVLGDTFGLNYAVDPRVTGTMSLQTSSPVDRDELIDLFEASLTVAGAAIVRRGTHYRIVPAADALGSTPAVSVPAATSRGPGVSVQVIELLFIGAEDMKTILEPISRPGSILRADPTRNNIVITGTSPDLKAMRDAIAVFDVDWMRGRSVALHPLKNSKPSSVANELVAIFSAGDKESSLVRFIPNERMNAVLVVATRPVYLARAAAWIRKLDQAAPTDGEQLFVYEIQNRPAKELAEVLQAVLSEGRSGQSPKPPAVAPDLQEASVNGPAGDQPAASPAVFQSFSEEEVRSLGVPSVVADIDNNALLISTTARNFPRIEQILRQLDALPTQVLLEVVIAEVTLNDELRFGLRWAIESGEFRFNLSSLSAAFAGGGLPAAAFISNNVQVTLQALASITDVNIVSSPTITALNNQQATLQVGDQVPILTRQSTGIENAASRVVNSVELKDTGLILNVTPRINSSGRVLLDINQEVSNVTRTTTSNIDSPTIQQRRLTTKAIVNDGESVALGGLIQERNSLERGQVPVIGDIPIVGNLFKQKTDTISRTELIIFIRPRIMRNVTEAREVTAEFRERLQFNSALKLRREGKTQLQRDLNRLKY